MANATKSRFLEELGRQFGEIRKLDGTQSLFDIAGGTARIYIRYSKLHSRNQAFYGLRREDLQQLEGHPSLICFLWEGQNEPLIIPFSEYEEVFHSVAPAGDGQFKVQVYLQNDGTELYISHAGRFNVESCVGWHELSNVVNVAKIKKVPQLTHSQVQTLLGAIGAAKQYDIWIPPVDRMKLDWSIAKNFECRTKFPSGFEAIRDVLQEVDLVWIQKGSNELKALFEVEHSTPIYSGLLRFNDIRLATPGLKPRFSIVANDVRRSLFVRQLNRPTFQASGLGELCTFLEYANVYGWHSRISVR
jgi:hypothetical protein